MGKKSSQGQEVESADTTKAQNSLSDADGAKAARKKRSPAAHQGIQVNFCKNPICLRKRLAGWLLPELHRKLSPEK